MKIINGTLFCEDRTLKKGEVFCDGDIIAEKDNNDAQIIDASGCIVAPGFVDIHIHGARGTDFCEGTKAANDNIASYLASVGVTSYCGTTMAFDKDKLVDMMRVASDIMDNPEDNHAVMRGINLEGPFAAVAKKGAMDVTQLKGIDIPFLDRVMEASGNRIKLVDVAPELDGATELIKHAAATTTVSLAHTAADYDTAKAGFEAGATHVTHLYNAMMGLSHREPGLVGAARDFTQHAELICDGIHIHPAAIRAAFDMFGVRLCLISDAMMACGMPNGEYELGGQQVFVEDGRATLANGTLAGSATAQTECFRRAVKLFGIPLETALTCCTESPAKAIREYDRIGSIAPGKRADFTLLDSKTLEVKGCIIGGKVVF